MYEKVNPCHPDKVADRIAGAIVDLAYTKSENPKVAVEVLLGHGVGLVITESSEKFNAEELDSICTRICGDEMTFMFCIKPQDKILAANQTGAIRCGDNGIFKGMPVTGEQGLLTEIAKQIYEAHPTDGKYILDGSRLIICQSNTEKAELLKEYPDAEINPVGYWTGGADVDAGATNRKLGSDMGDSVTGGGLHGKDLSKADVSVNIYAWLKAQELGRAVEFSCAIGDETIDGKSYSEIVEIAREYIQSIGGFEKFAAWGLIR